MRRDTVPSQRRAVAQHMRGTSAVGSANRQDPDDSAEPVGQRPIAVTVEQARYPLTFWSPAGCSRRAALRAARNLRVIRSPRWRRHARRGIRLAASSSSVNRPGPPPRPVAAWSLMPEPAGWSAPRVVVRITLSVRPEQRRVLTRDYAHSGPAPHARRTGGPVIALSPWRAPLQPGRVLCGSP
jgi:hypothetical protein